MYRTRPTASRATLSGPGLRAPLLNREEQRPVHDAQAAQDRDPTGNVIRGRPVAEAVEQAEGRGDDRRRYQYREAAGGLRHLRRLLKCLSRGPGIRQTFVF